MKCKRSVANVSACVIVMTFVAGPGAEAAGQSEQSSTTQTSSSGQQPAPTPTDPATQGQTQQGEQNQEGQQPQQPQQTGQQEQQPPPESGATPTGVLVPTEPAAPLLSAGVHAARSTRPGRAFERPYRGVFGGTAIGPGQPGMFLRLSAYGAYDDNVLGTQRGGDRPGTQAAGYYTSGNGTLSYLHAGDRLTLSAGATGELRYYDVFDDTSKSASAHAAADFRLGRRYQVALRQAISRAELYRLGGLPGLTGPSLSTADAEFNLARRDRLATDSMVSLTRELTSKSRISGDYAYRRAESAGTTLDLNQYAAGATYIREVGRFSNLQLGYHRRSAVYGAGETERRIVVNNLNLGGGYVRPLSFSRRTTLSLTGGTGMITRAAFQELPETNYYRVTGTAGLEHELGRTWTMVGSYTRGMQFVEGFDEPFFLDTARVTLQGLLRPRTELSTSLGYTDGRLQLSTQQNPYSSLAGTARIGYALSTSIEIAVDYAYRHYQFDTTAGVPLAIAQGAGRHSIGLSVGYWLPIFTTR